MKIDDRIVERVLNNAASPEEAKMVSEWFAVEEGQDFLSHYMTELTTNLTEEEVEVWLDHEVPKERMKARFINQIHTKQKKKISRYLIVAAVLIPFLLLGATIFFLAERTGFLTPPQYAELIVPHGEQMQVVLQDGTTVLLNSQTKIRYPLKFGLFNRVIELSGEAYFNVAKETGRSFIVNLNSLKIKVTGTKFNVKAYEDELIWVTLDEGGVLLEDTKSLQYTLKPGDSAEYDRDSGSCRITRPGGENMETITAWKNNKLN